MDRLEVVVYTLASAEGRGAIAPNKTMFDGDDRFDSSCRSQNSMFRVI